MTEPRIEERPGGAVLFGTRISVDDVLIRLLDPALTEEAIAEIYSLTIPQVAAARAYILTHPDTVLSERMEDELKAQERLNPAEVTVRAGAMRRKLQEFREWIEAQEAIAAEQNGLANGVLGPIPTFREWLAERATRQMTGS